MTRRTRANYPLAALDTAKRYARKLVPSGLSPLLYMNQYGSQRVVCGTDGTKLWSFNSSGLYQVDSVSSTSWAAKTLPTNVVTTNGAKVIVPPTGSPGAGLMYLLAYNSTAAVFQVYSAPLTTGSTAPTWSGPLLSLATNATLIPNAFRACSTGILVGEYSGGTNIAAGPSVYRSTDGVAFSTVLGPLSTTRHVHGIYEDPFNLGTIYVTVGDQGIPHWCYRSRDGGATFSPVNTHDDSVGSTWQSVSVGFTADYVVFIGDQVQGLGPFLMDRADDSLRWATARTKFSRLAVPGGAGGRYITDLAITSGSTTATSATAAFTSLDTGRMIQGPNNIQDGTFITYVNATTVTLSRTATGTQSGLTALIGGDRFFETAYEGLVDPSTGAIYVIPNDTSNRGNTAAVFCLPEPGADWALMHIIPLATGSTAIGSHEPFLVGNQLFIDRYGPITIPPLASIAT